jgi:hypothetical protein
MGRGGPLCAPREQVRNTHNNALSLNRKLLSSFSSYSNCVAFLSNFPPPPRHFLSFWWWVPVGVESDPEAVGCRGVDRPFPPLTL